ncbi:hypothetical protein BJ165DRAFT_1435171 [Panaeolus papilionaceus]|nr:hypothetical protein BJ165DRAFT_1435171 [Panaeolus papilionaceus]
MENNENLYTLPFPGEYLTAPDSCYSSRGEYGEQDFTRTVTNTAEAVSPNNHNSEAHQLARDSNRFVAVSVITIWGGEKGQRDKQPMVARVSICDYYGGVLLDTYVHPRKLIQDCRASKTGISYNHLCGAPKYPEIKQQVRNIIQNKILVGHRIWSFLSALELSHSALNTRDMALYIPLRESDKTEYDSVVELPVLVKRFLGVDIGQGFEDSVS